jgi:hypothetical protein
MHRSTPLGGGKKLVKLIPKQRGAMYYMRSGQEFDDTKPAMNLLLPVSFSKDEQSWNSCRGRIDTECRKSGGCVNEVIQLFHVNEVI